MSSRTTLPCLSFVSATAMESIPPVDALLLFPLLPPPPPPPLDKDGEFDVKVIVERSVRELC